MLFRTRFRLACAVVGVLGLFTYCNQPSPQVVAAQYGAEELLCVHAAKTAEEADDCACKVRQKYDSGTAWKVCDAGSDSK